MVIYKGTIPESKKTNFNAKIKVLQKKLEKMGLSQLKVTFGQKYFCIKSALVQVPVEITGESPIIKVGDFTYAGTIKVESHGTLLYPASEEDDYHLIKYKDLDYLPCDHCNTTRKRKKVFVFVDSCGETKVIASSCSREYFGIDIEKTIDQSIYFSDLGGRIGNFIDVSEDTYNKEVFANITYKILKEDNGIKPAKFCTNATAVQAEMKYNEIIKDTIKSKFEYLSILHSSSFEISDFFSYWATYEPLKSFENNVKTAVFSKFINYNLFVWAVYLYIKSKGDGFKQEPKPNNSNFVGTIGEKITIENVKVVQLYRKDQGYNWFNVVKLLDQNGNNYTTFDSKSQFKNDSVYSLTATVKDHNEYKGIKSTVINRIKVMEV